MLQDSTPDKASQPTCVYIAGYGRSGSTVLDSILGNHPEIFGGGELCNLWLEIKKARLCSCQSPLRECPVWSRVLQDAERSADPMALYQQWFKETRLVEGYGPMPGAAIRSSYVQVWKDVMHGIVSSTQKSMIVDSSKNTRRSHRRPYLIQSELGFNLKVVHLVRDPRAVMYSAAKGSNRVIEYGQGKPKVSTGIRGLYGWTFSNLAAEKLKAHVPSENYLLLRYEDLVKEPVRSLAALSKFLNQDFGVVQSMLDEGTPFNPGHGISGNRMRRESKPLRLKYDAEWETKLAPMARKASVLVSRLARRYGYETG